MSDEPSLPESKPTVQLPAMTDRALLEDLARTMRAGFRRVERIEITVSALGDNYQGMNLRMATMEGRVAKLEYPSSIPPPPAPITSVRVRDLIESHPSQMDLEHEAKLAMALVALAEEKAKREKLESESATKADLERVELKTDAQTQILQQLLKLTEKPVVKLIATAVGTAVLTWLTARGLR